MRYRVHIEMSRDGYPLRLQTALLVGGSSLLPLPGLDGWHVAACLLHFLRK